MKGKKGNSQKKMFPPSWGTKKTVATDPMPNHKSRRDPTAKTKK